jgi:predicted Zn-ribbon and HTH transcriptional regulator
MGEILLKGYQCERCGHKWVPREESDYPKVCPKCKSPYWDKPRKIEKKRHDMTFNDKRKLR